MDSTIRRRAGSALAAAALAAAALWAAVMLAGCAPASPPGIATVDGSPGAHSSDQGAGGDAVKFAECMRENGIADFPDPDPNAGGPAISIPPGVDPEVAKGAMRACRQFEPTGEAPAPPSAVDLAAARAFAECMRDNGIENYPDPSADGTLVIESDPTDPNGIDLNSDEFERAKTVCDRSAMEPGADDGTGGDTP